MALTRPRRARALNRERIIAAAKQLCERGGVERLTIRALAEALEVSPMAVYRHFPGKAAIVSQMLNAFIAEARVTDHSEADWRAWLLETACRMHRALACRPELLPLLGDALLLGEEAVEVMERCLGVLVAAGCSQRQAVRVFFMIIQTVVGSVTLAAAAARPATASAGPAPALAQQPTVVAALAHIGPVLRGEVFAELLRDQLALLVPDGAGT